MLTDPIYGERASPLSWAGPERVRAPGIAFEDLPPIDVVLISHDHYDHLDLETLQRLRERGRGGEPPTVLAGLGVGALLDEHDIERHHDLDWEDSIEVAGLQFTFTECRHRSGRGLTDQMETLWGSFVIEAPEGKIYFAGDTGYGPHFAATGERHGPFDLALLPIGAYEPRDFMAAVHLNPAEAVQAHLDLESDQSIGMHFGTFQLTFEGIDEPAADLAKALEEQDLEPERFWVLGFGESRALP